MPGIVTGHTPQGLIVNLTRDSGAVVAISGIPDGSVLTFATGGGSEVTSIADPGEDEGVHSWVLSQSDVADLSSGRALLVNVTHGGVVLLAGRVQWHSAWSGSCGTDGTVRYVGGPPGPPGGPGVGVPTGGSVGQVLGKTGTGDFETGWVDQTGGGGGAVDSVNGQTGVVMLDASDVGALPASTPIPSTPGDVGAAPAVHAHTISDVTGLTNALDGKQPTGDYATRSELFSGAYGDLTGRPSIPAVPGDIGAQPAGDYVTDNDARLTDARTPLPHTHPASDVTGLATVATTGAYGDLTDKPTIPAAGVQSVVAGDGVTVDATDPANPVVSAEGGGGGSPLIASGGTAPATATHTRGLAVGPGASTGASNDSVAVGASSSAPADSVSIGKGASSTAQSSGNVTIGADTLGGNINSSGNVIIGWKAKFLSYSAAVAVGAESGAGQLATALGKGAQAPQRGSVALGYNTTTTATDQVAVGSRDVEVQDPTRGYILWSPDGTRWRLTVDNNGDLTTTAL